MAKLRMTILGCLVFLTFLSCQNPMVNYLLRTEEPPKKIIPLPVLPVPVALWNGDWYNSLAEAAAAADDGTSPLSPSVIYIGKDISNIRDLGGNGIVLSAGKFIRLEPYLPNVSGVVIQREQNKDALFTVESGASLALGDGLIIDGAEIIADSPLVSVKAGGDFLMDSGAELRRGRSSGDRGAGVFVEDAASFTMRNGTAGAACVRDCDVYLEKDALITVEGTLAVNPAARITPAAYITGQQVITGVTLPNDLDNNNWKFDVSPEQISGWGGLSYWRINTAGELYHVVARRYDSVSDTTVWYETLQKAVDESFGSRDDPVEVTLISNVDFTDAVNERVIVRDTNNVRLVVPEDSRYIIKRKASSASSTSTENMFFVSIGGYLDLGFVEGAPAGSELIIDGGAVWSADSPAEDSTVNSGLTSSQALIKVDGAMGDHGRFRLNAGVTLRNNDRSTGDGSGVESWGRFVMTGGTITRNRAAGGSGGGIYFGGDNFSSNVKIISGGSVIENDAALSGGGIMIDVQQDLRLTMTEGLISGNRARGKLSSEINSDFDGYGGGIFIPGNGTHTGFTMQGGTISDNKSDSGKGHGVAMDFLWLPVSTFAISGDARITGNDIHLYNKSENPDNNIITIDGNLSAPDSSIPLTLHSYPPSGSDLKVLGGASSLVSGNYRKFSVETPRQLQSDGRLYSP
jgi:hypothetical protein